MSKKSSKIKILTIHLKENLCTILKPNQTPTNQKSSNIDNPTIKDIKDNNNSIEKPIKEEQSKIMTI